MTALSAYLVYLTTRSFILHSTQYYFIERTRTSRKLQNSVLEKVNLTISLEHMVIQKSENASVNGQCRNVSGIKTG